MHGFEGVQLKIGKIFKYMGMIVYPCVVPKLRVKKILSGQEEKPINFNVSDVFLVGRARKEKLESNLNEKHTQFIPKEIVTKYKKMLTDESFGQNLGVMVKSNGKHGLFELKDKREEKTKESKEKSADMKRLTL